MGGPAGRQAAGEGSSGLGVSSDLDGNTREHQVGEKQRVCVCGGGGGRGGGGRTRYRRAVLRSPTYKTKAERRMVQATPARRKDLVDPRAVRWSQSMMYCVLMAKEASEGGGGGGGTGAEQSMQEWGCEQGLGAFSR